MCFIVNKVADILNIGINKQSKSGPDVREMVTL